MRRDVPARAGGLLVGYLADAVFGDPSRAHPVSAFGAAVQGLERVVWADSRGRGAAYAAICVAAPAAGGACVERLTRSRPLVRFAATAAATWTVLGMRGLTAEATAMQRLLAAGDLPGARVRLAHLCGRDAGSLDADALIRASCESIAENTSDAVVAPLLWGGLAGIPGLLGYRALNTLDAMVGHPSPRYARFGWAAARGDDLANLLPARISAMLAVAAAPAVRGSPVRALVTWRRDGRKHPSPNAGIVEAAFAGALGVRLGGQAVYRGAVEDRPALGDGAHPAHTELRGATRLARVLGCCALGVSVGLGWRQHFPLRRA